MNDDMCCDALPMVLRMDKVLHNEHRDEVLKPPLQLCSFITYVNVLTSLNPNKFMTGFEMVRRI